MENMVFDLTKPHCYYFNEICKIPHGSRNEKALSDWICSIAREHGLSYLQDDMWNVVVYVPATPGYEDHKGLIIQAHIDMVCEKRPESTHNFETDPLELHVEGTHLMANGTTLGGDDCMGAAYMLDIMTDETLKHPYLELCFTVQEEIGLFGAMALKPEYFKARQLVNLDGGGEIRTYTTLAGARNLIIEKDLKMAPCADAAYDLHVYGLLGGRPGDDISKERANAVKLMAKCLYAFHEAGIAVRLAAGQSGVKVKTGICADVDVTFCTTARVEDMEHVLAGVRATIRDEYEYFDPDITVELTKAEPCAMAAGEKETEELVEFIHLLPFGVINRFLPLAGPDGVTGLPSYSANIGRFRVEDGRAIIQYAGRSPFESYLDETRYTVDLLSRKLGLTVTGGNDYYGYRYLKESPLRDTLDRVFLAQYGYPIKHMAAHGGNECGAFKHMHPDMDIVTSGAIYAKHHTPEEYLDLESFDRCIRLLKSLVEAL